MVNRSRLLLLSAASKAVDKSADGAAKALSSAASAKSTDIANDSRDSATTNNANATLAPQVASPMPAPYIRLYHHRDPSLFRSRRPGSLSYLFHHISSTTSAMISLISSQQARDRFLELTGPDVTAPGDSDGSSSVDSDVGNIYNSCIINTNVLGQSDMGFLKVLTLYQDLDSPLYADYGNGVKFDIKEFMDGCGFALEQFHNTKEALFSGENFRKWVDSVVSDVNDSTDSSKVNDKDKNHGFIPGVKEMASINHYDFKIVAKTDPDSVEQAMMDMTTPHAWEMINFNGKMRMLVGDNGDRVRMRAWNNGAMVRMGGDTEEGIDESYHLVQDSTKVVHVALLSADIKEIEAPLVESSTKLAKKSTHESELIDSVDPDAPLEDDSLIPHRPDTSEEKESLQVVTQLEVLYDLEQTYVNEKGNNRTQTAVMVGKFEACVHGDPNGDELRWRLCNFRPAYEFGYNSLW